MDLLDLTSRKRKREDESSLITFVIEGHNLVFDRLLEACSVDDLKECVKRKLKHGPGYEYNLTHIRDGDRVQLLDGEDFAAFTLSARMYKHSRVIVSVREPKLPVALGSATWEGPSQDELQQALPPAKRKKLVTTDAPEPRSSMPNEVETRRDASLPESFSDAGPTTATITTPLDKETGTGTPSPPAPPLVNIAEQTEPTTSVTHIPLTGTQVSPPTREPIDSTVAPQPPKRRGPKPLTHTVEVVINRKTPSNKNSILSPTVLSSSTAQKVQLSSANSNSLVTPAVSASIDKVTGDSNAQDSADDRVPSPKRPPTGGSTAKEGGNHPKEPPLAGCLICSSIKRHNHYVCPLVQQLVINEDPQARAKLQERVEVMSGDPSSADFSEIIKFIRDVIQDPDEYSIGSSRSEPNQSDKMTTGTAHEDSSSISSQDLHSDRASPTKVQKPPEATIEETRNLTSDDIEIELPKKSQPSQNAPEIERHRSQTPPSTLSKHVSSSPFAHIQSSDSPKSGSDSEDSEIVPPRFTNSSSRARASVRPPPQPLCGDSESSDAATSDSENDRGIKRNTIPPVVSMRPTLQSTPSASVSRPGSVTPAGDQVQQTSAHPAKNITNENIPMNGTENNVSTQSDGGVAPHALRNIGQAARIEQPITKTVTARAVLNPRRDSPADKKASRRRPQAESSSPPFPILKSGKNATKISTPSAKTAYPSLSQLSEKKGNGVSPPLIPARTTLTQPRNVLRSDDDHSDDDGSSSSESDDKTVPEGRKAGILIKRSRDKQDRR